MRILLINFGYQNLNRTVMLWPLAWREVGQVTLFGPGHVPDEDWRAGLGPFLRKNGPFDVVVAAEFLVTLCIPEYTREHLIEALDRVYDCPFDIPNAVDGTKRVHEEFMEMDAIRVVSMLEFDCYNMYPGHKALLDRIDAHVVGWGEDFIRPRSQLTALARETFGARANDHWWDFVTGNRHRVISSAGMIAENEFDWTGLDHRRQRWAVQGARYAARREARRHLSEAGIPWSGRGLVDLISVIGRINAKALRWPLVRTMLNHLWEQGFRTSRYAFTCGSALRFPIRKYFEIPAAGAVLAAEAPNGFAELGFRDRENAVVTAPETIVETDAWLKANPADARRIADAGRELVWARHTVQARGQQYRRAIEAIAAKRFAGSRWSGGEFVVTEPAARGPAASEAATRP